MTPRERPWKLVHESGAVQSFTSEDNMMRTYRALPIRTNYRSVRIQSQYRMYHEIDGQWLRVYPRREG